MSLGLTARNPGKNGVTWRHMASQPCGAWTYVRPRLPSPPRGLISAIAPLREGRLSDTLSGGTEAGFVRHVSLSAVHGPGSFVAFGAGRPQRLGSFDAFCLLPTPGLGSFGDVRARCLPGLGSFGAFRDVCRLLRISPGSRSPAACVQRTPAGHPGILDYRNSRALRAIQVPRIL